MYKEKRQRADMLAEIEILLLDFEKRLQFSAVPIREWLSDVVGVPQFSRLSFLKETLNLLSENDLETAWRKSVENIRILSADDMSILRLLGTHLGKSDIFTQLQCVKETVKKVSVNKQQAEETAKQSQKLYVSLGACAGMAVAVLLV